MIIRSLTLCAGLSVLMALATSGVRADDGRRAPPVPLLPQYAEECGACHTAYPPRMLPAQSWQRLVGGLDRHFGVDASLDAATARQIGDWLAANANDRVAAPAQDRITRTQWFQREHREIPVGIWSRPTVQSPSRCSACHLHADQGQFDEHAVRIPR